jgi:hypothetical protein
MAEIVDPGTSSDGRAKSLKGDYCSFMAARKTPVWWAAATAAAIIFHVCCSKEFN